jgi:hypothetical protein
MQKYRTQRRVIGPAYTEKAMKNYESDLNVILEEITNTIMLDRQNQSTDVDEFTNLFALGS